MNKQPSLSQSAAAYWQSLEIAAAKRRELAKVTHEMRNGVRPQYKVAQNDEPDFFKKCEAEARAIVRGQS